MDPTGLVVMRGVFDIFKSLSLDGIFTFSEYFSYNVSCTHDGLFLSHSEKGIIVVLGNDLQILYHHGNLVFDGIKHTKVLALLETPGNVKIYRLGQGFLENEDWELTDVVTNIHSPGMINKALNIYYEPLIIEE
jgi:hypothetical protein